jgi:hypothetical protein
MPSTSDKKTKVPKTAGESSNDSHNIDQSTKSTSTTSTAKPPPPKRTAVILLLVLASLIPVVYYPPVDPTPVRATTNTTTTAYMNYYNQLIASDDVILLIHRSKWIVFHAFVAFVALASLIIPGRHEETHDRSHLHKTNGLSVLVVSLVAFYAAVSKVGTHHGCLVDRIISLTLALDRDFGQQPSSMTTCCL